MLEKSNVIFTFKAYGGEYNIQVLLVLLDLKYSESLELFSQEIE